MMEKEDISIVKIFREVVNEVSNELTAKLQATDPKITAVHRFMGHISELQAKLIDLSKGSLTKFDRYPLIALFEDIKITTGESGGYYGYSPLHFMILYPTKKEIYTEERESTVFEPYLYPIKKELEKQLYSHENIVFEYEGKRKIEETRRPHWGAPAKYDNKGYILNDILDGIEFFIPRITFKQNCI